MDEPMAPYTRFVVDGFDADALLGVVRDTRFEQRLLAAGHFRACLQRLVFPEFSLDSGAYTLPIFASGSFAQGMIALALAISCERPMWANGRLVEVGQVMVFAEDSELNVRPSPGGWQWAVLLIPREVLQREAVLRVGRELRLPRTGWHTRPAPPPAAEGVRHAVFKALEAAAAWEGVITPAQMAAQASLLLGAFVEAVSAGDAGPARRLDGWGSARHRDALVRRAEDYLKAHLERPFDSRALALALGVGERQIERLFRDAYGHGPCHWHQLARLNRARTALLHADERGTVTDIALRFGFSHLGRFSILYRHVFGECPKDTLRG
ncbi:MULTISPECIES: AraC family transcriptional regulator [Stenotrophomonas]|jgi:AraC-like DNA-binding protein|uniref:AraC family transcriptional regulator n=1 Tax=Stenotrophomonas TaxID=40323 RepID=UPI0002D96368|nr:AraC family transcriptional regulator [Stenotrophomonas sp. BIO128-Bstrain]WIA62774.1 AraC family transcriptional regulator [Stenotrophomonas sp. BIO128-Bstrain]